MMPSANIRSRRSLKMLRRNLRRQATTAEVVLWNALRRRQLYGRKFRRQYSVGSYILDFYCAQAQLAIELDGAVHNDPLRRRYDEERTAFLRTHGIRVIRFENQIVLNQIDVVLDAIAWHFDNGET